MSRAESTLSFKLCKRCLIEFFLLLARIFLESVSLFLYCYLLFFSCFCIIASKFSLVLCLSVYLSLSTSFYLLCLSTFSHSNCLSFCFFHPYDIFLLLLTYNIYYVLAFNVISCMTVFLAFLFFRKSPFFLFLFSKTFVFSFLLSPAFHVRF